MATENWHYTPEWPHWETQVCGHLDISIVQRCLNTRDFQTVIESVCVRYETKLDGPSNSTLCFFLNGDE
jgi:hypothetical protein